MATLHIEELVSQAESEQVTLAEMISRKLTPQQMDEIQNGLSTELAMNYCRIERFMSEVKVPSLDELMGLEELPGTSHNANSPGLDVGLSDNTI